MAGDTFNTATGYENVKGSNKTPEQIEAERRASQLVADQRTQQQTAAANTGNVTSRQNSYGGTMAGVHEASTAGRGAGIELPFIGAIPYAGPILEGAVEGVQGGALAAGDYALDNPLTTLATGGLAAGVAGADKLVDETASGVAQAATGNSRAAFDVPLTPAQLWDPSGPMYDPGRIDGSGTVDSYGVKDLGEDIGDVATAAGDWISGIPGDINDWLMGGGAGGTLGGAAGYGAGGAAMSGALGSAERLRGMGASVPGANPADAARQEGVLGAAQDFTTGPRATADALANAQQISRTPGMQQQALGDVNRTRATPGAQAGVLGQASALAARPGAQAGVMPGVDEFLAGPEGPSAAELQLRQAQDDSMSDALSLARSARGGAGAKNRALRVAVAENAATQSGAARDTALLRAKEAEARRAETLSGLGLKGDLAQGIDQRDIAALGLSGDLARGVDQRDLDALGLGASLSQGIDQRQMQGAELQGSLSRGLDTDTLAGINTQAGLASDMRNAGVTERGQSLDFTRGMEQTAAGLEGDVLSAIPQLEQVRHADQYELTPEQKMRLALLGAGGDLLSTFF